MNFPIFLILGLSSSLVYGRTWTSVDGSKTIEAEYISSLAGNVTVFKNGRQLTVSLATLSQADRDWVSLELKRKEAEDNKPKVLQPEETLIGKQLMGRVSKFGKTSYKKAKLEKGAEFYLVYFSASW